MNYVYKRIYLLILLVGILSSLIFGYHTYTNNLEKEQIQFNSLTKKVIQQINNRMATYREILYSGVSFFEASHHVSRDEWHIFVNKLQLKELFPGIQGLGYSLVLRENELEKNMQDIQAEGFPNYKIKPEGKRDLYTSIIYLEPFDQRNQRAFGYDMFSEENRRNAMSRSIELGLPSLSNKVRLVQENGKDEQSGFLLYTPHYKKNYPLENKEQRYEAIEGFVYAVFRTKDFIHGAVGDSLEMLDIKMYDGKEKNENSLLLNSNTKTEENKTFNKTVQVELDGHIWTFEITAKDSFLDNQQNIYSLIFTLLGFAITFLIALLVKRQGEIEVLKDDALLNVSQGVMVTNSYKEIIYANKAFEKLTGYKRESIYGQKPNFLQGKDTDIESIVFIKENLKKLIPFECELLNYRKDGTTFWNRLSVTPILDEKNNIKRYIGIRNDITEKKILEKDMLFEKKLIENILNNTNAIIALIDMKGVMIKLNEYGKKFVGHTQEEISAEPYFWKKFIPEDMREKVANIIKEAKKNNLTEKKKNSWISSSGEEKIFEWSNQLIKDSNGTPEYIITVGIDVTNDVIAQEEYKKYQKQLELSAQISGLAFWELNLKTNIFTFNDLFFTFLNTNVEKEGGYLMTVEEYLQRFILQEDQEIIRNEIKTALTKSKEYQESIEHDIKRRDGEILKVLVNYFVAYDIYGNPDKIYGTKYNLTKQKEKEKILIEAKQKAQDLLYEQNTLLSLFDKGDSVLFKWKNNEHWDIEYVSNSVEKLLGYNITDFTSEKIKYISCIHQDDKATLIEEVKDAENENKDFFTHKPYRIITKDNKIKWVLDYTVTQKDRNGNIIYFIGYIIDITEQKEQEEKLYLLSLIAEKNLNAVIISDKEGRIEWVNSSFEKMSGYVKEDLVGIKPGYLLQGKETDPETINYLKNQISKGHPFNCEIINYSKFGEKYWVKIQGQALYNKKGEIIRFFAIEENITNKKILENQREELVASLAKTNKELEDYAQIVSHDLKSPLRSIHSLISWIKEDSDKGFSDQTLSYFSMIENKVEKMDYLIQGILTYSKIDKEELPQESINTHQIIQSIINMIHIPNHISITIKNQLPMLHADRYRIQQLFQNIIGNAVNYIEEEVGLVEVASEEFDDYYVFSIKDNGVGIAKEHHEKIFNTFQSYTKSEHSTGLGLAIVKKIIDAYNGKIWVDSELEKGSTFFIKLNK